MRATYDMMTTAEHVTGEFKTDQTFSDYAIWSYFFPF